MKDWKHDEATRSWLDAYMDEQDLTNSEMARRLTFGTTRISKYRNLDKGHEPEPDMPKVEASIKAYRLNVERKMSRRAALFETSASLDAFRIFRQIRSTGDIGLITGAAGVGKTSAGILFSLKDPSTLLITGARKKRNADAVAGMLFRELLNSDPSLRWDGRITRYQWLEDRLRGSSRIIVADNAHKLDFSGLEVLFDLHDETGVAIALMGNPEVIDSVKRSDQLFSRIGIRRELKLRKDSAEVAQRVCNQELPQATHALVHEAENVVGSLGCLRRLRKQLILCRDLLLTTAFRQTPDVDVFRIAGKQLVTAD